MHKALVKFKHIIVMLLASAPVFAEEKGTTIIGSEEAPTVLNVVPWKTKELGADPWQKTDQGPSSSILDDVLQPIDRDELRREVQYFNLLHPKETDAPQTQ